MKNESPTLVVGVDSSQTELYHVFDLLLLREKIEHFGPTRIVTLKSLLI